MSAHPQMDLQATDTMDPITDSPTMVPIESSISPPDDAASSSSSSYVPVEPVQDAIQLIDKNKTFNQSVLDYVAHASNPAADHRIISVFGSQSTGKSTLLNALFHTNFGVMDEGNRQQTTTGIWLAQSPGVSNSVGQNGLSDNILVMDVEGTDGRERGEDQDFERKAALFALATSEVLIVNLWETQVGLYQGANMGLLKTVFEVNLSLFGRAKASDSDHKVLLLFVIRDHLGVTPQESLAATITADLLKIWDNLSKPADVAHLAFSDFFDLAFHTLSHKVLQNDKFLADVRELGNRFVDPSNEQFLFKPNYHHDIPIDAWTLYAERCWDQIDNNKDLDLPTQQILVAKFKCDEIATACYDEFVKDFASHKSSAADAIGGDVDYTAVGANLAEIKESVLSGFDAQASKYNPSVYAQRRDLLGEKVNSKLAEIVAVYAKHLLASSVRAFSTGLSKKQKGVLFTDAVSTARESVASEFAQNLAQLSLGGQLSTNEYAQSLQTELASIEARQQVVELNAFVSKYLKKLNNSLSTTILDEIATPTESTWDTIKAKFDDIQKTFLSNYSTESGVYDFGVGASEAVNRQAAATVEYKSWETFAALLHKYISKDNLFNILRERFDDKFRYDDNGIPRLYQNAKELDIHFAEAKAHALDVFPILSHAKFADGSELVPAVDLKSSVLKRRFESVRLEPGHYEEEHEDESDDEEDTSFAEILTEKERAEVMAKFKKDISARYVETKRSIIQHVTQIPYYIYLVILVLGWNEFMAVLRNPFFFTLLVMIGAGVYVMYQMNLLGPAMIVGQRMVDEAVNLGKQKLREFIVDDHQQHARNLGKISEEIELEDMSEAAESD